MRYLEKRFSVPAPDVDEAEWNAIWERVPKRCPVHGTVWVREEQNLCPRRDCKMALIQGVQEDR